MSTHVVSPVRTVAGRISLLLRSLISDFRKAAWLVLGLCVFIAPGTFSVHADPQPVVAGQWSLDKSESDELDDKLDDIARRYTAGFRSGRLDAAATAHRRQEKQRRRQFDPIRAIATAPTLRISGARIVEIHYGDALTRTLQPNPEGRVYSASGEELIEDEFGRSLSFWEGAALVVETSNGSGIKMTERYRVNQASAHLVAKLTIKARGEVPIEMTRRYLRTE